MSETYLGRWIDESINLWSPGIPNPNNGVDETDLEVAFRGVTTVEQLARHLRIASSELAVGPEANLRKPVYRGKVFLGMFVGSLGDFQPSQAGIDLARERIG